MSQREWLGVRLSRARPPEWIGRTLSRPQSATPRRAACSDQARCRPRAMKIFELLSFRLREERQFAGCVSLGRG